jgi:hypothetical protein
MKACSEDRYFCRSLRRAAVMTRGRGSLEDGNDEPRYNDRLTAGYGQLLGFIRRRCKKRGAGVACPGLARVPVLTGDRRIACR